MITDRATWLEWRKGYLGASEVAAAAGLDPWRSKLSLWVDKAGRSPRPPAENASMRRGRHAEPMALGYLAELKPKWKIERPNIWITDDDCRLACTPDAYAWEDGALINVQIKTVARSAFERWNGVPPVAYQVQVTAENMLTGASRGVLAVLVNTEFSAELKLFKVRRIEAAEQRIREIARAFWRDVEAGKRPLPDFSRDHEAIAALFPQAEPGTVIDLSGDNRVAAILPRRSELKNIIGAATTELDSLEDELKFKIGAAEAAVLPGWKISYRQRNKRGYWVKPSSGRKLLVTNLQEDAA